MMKAKHSPKRSGRPTKEDYLRLRGKAFEMVLEKWQGLGPGALIDYKTAEEALDVNRKTARLVFRDIADISSEVALIADGIRVGRPTYYHSSIRVSPALKSAIADKCVDVIPPNMTLGCGPGSTVALCVRHLIEARRYHVIVSNNLGIIDQVGGREISDLVLTGGEYHAGIHACVGNDAIAAFARARTEGALIGVSGINEDGELFVRHSEEIGVVNQIVRSATRFIFVVADVHKLTQVDTWRFVGIRDLLKDNEKPNLNVCLVTNSSELLSKGHEQELAKQVEKRLQAMGAESSGRVQVVVA